MTRRRPDHLAFVDDDDSTRPDWMGDPGPALPPLPPRVPERDDVDDHTPPGGSYRNVRWVPNWRPSNHF